MESYPVQTKNGASEKSSIEVEESSSAFESLEAYLKGGINGKEPAKQVAETCSHGVDVEVEVVDKEGVIELIRVRCKCGEITEIRCSYDLGQRNGTVDA